MGWGWGVALASGVGFGEWLCQYYYTSSVGHIGLEEVPAVDSHQKGLCHFQVMLL